MYEVLQKNSAKSKNNNTKTIMNSVKNVFEMNSGYSFDNVRVHYQSEDTTPFQAIRNTPEAYTERPFSGNVRIHYSESKPEPVVQRMMSAQQFKDQTPIEDGLFFHKRRNKLNHIDSTLEQLDTDLANNPNFDNFNDRISLLNTLMAAITDYDGKRDLNFIKNDCSNEVQISGDLNNSYLSMFHDRSNLIADVTDLDARIGILNVLNTYIIQYNNIADNKRNLTQISDERLNEDTSCNQIKLAMNNVKNDQLDTNPTSLASRIPLLKQLKNDSSYYSTISHNVRNITALIPTVVEESDKIDLIVQDQVDLTNVGNLITKTSDKLDLFKRLFTNISTYIHLTGYYKRNLSPYLIQTQRNINMYEELKRILDIQMQNPDVQKNLDLNHANVSIVPSDMKMTDLTEYFSLRGAKTFDGRTWENVRGVGNVSVGSDTYAAVTEENLLGKDTSMGGAYTRGYSTSTHELAHLIHLKGLEPSQKTRITNAYTTKKTKIENAATVSQDDWADGPYYDTAKVTTAGSTNKAVLSANALETNYSSRNELEYFAQLTNTYLGTNTGIDPYTGKKRNNGRYWIVSNESPDILNLLDALYNKGALNDINPDGSLSTAANARLTNPHV